MAELAFTLDARSPAQRRLTVTLTAPRSAWPAGGGLRPATDPADGTAIVELFLPAWTPGSYLIREYARQLGPVAAFDGDTGERLPCRKTAKNRFGIELLPAVRSVRVEYSVYAHELSVRTADLTTDHAYWNHACVLLWPVGGTALGASIQLRVPAGWDIACALPRASAPADGPANGTEGAGRGGDAGEVSAVLVAADLDNALDAPVLAGRFSRLSFSVGGVPHEVVLDGLGPLQPPPHFVDDLTRVVERAADVFGGALPYPQYLFLCLFTDSGHGGLEHAESTTLLAARTALQPGKDYQQFLALCAHELFHAWNVKRMRPAEFWRYDYERENHTSMLWLVEGFTAYYDDLLVRRAGASSPADYLALVGKNLDALQAGPGRLQQSLSEASHDAWIRLYRPDENTRNSTQNYYGNGAVAALLLDLTIRSATGGARSLDDTLRALWQRTWLQGRGYTREDVQACLAEAAGRDLSELLASLVDRPLDPDPEPLLREFGVELQRKDRNRPFVGMSFDEKTAKVTFVADGGPAWVAGIAPGDELLALDGMRVTGDTWADRFAAVARVDAAVRVLVATRGLLRECSLVPAAAPGGHSLQLVAEPTPDQLRLRTGWLGA